jgi:hypothetical protein
VTEASGIECGTSLMSAAKRFTRNDLSVLGRVLKKKLPNAIGTNCATVPLTTTVP